MRRPELLFLLLSSLFLFQTTNGHNITHLLAGHPSLTTFNHYLTLTHLAGEINRRATITILALDNAAMDSILAKSPSINTIKNILSLHVLLDYFGAKKLHQISNGTALAATMYQATGSAAGSSGFVNITDIKGGKVAFGPEENDGVLNTYFVKSVEELPYNISVIQISKPLPSAEAAAPTPGPSQLNLTDRMSAHGCKVFADTLIANPDALSTYQDNVEGGLTVFCPGDDPMKAFLPKFKNLTAGEKTSFLEFYGVPVYQTMAMLRSNNGVMNTLATDGAKKFDFTVQNDGQDVTLKTKSTTAKIIGTLLDEDPVAVYTINKVLIPKELSKTAPPAPAPAPSEAADAPKPSKTKKGKAKAAPSPDDADADAPAPGEDDPADQTADDSAAVRVVGIRFAVSGLSLLFGLLLSL